MENAELQKYSLVISSSYRSALEALAHEQGYKWGDRGNVKALIEAIAKREIPLGQKATWSEREQAALVQAALALRDRSEAAAARELVNLLLRYSDLLPELRSLLNESFGLFSRSSIEKVQDCIERQQPFQLAYQDALHRQWTFTVRYAEVVFREKRNYLECWCEETEGNQDLPELQHNWSHRLERIADAGIVPIEGEWRNGLDTVEVKFELFGGLAHAYQQRSADVSVEWVSAEPPTKQVVRHISNTFWFIREALPYGKDCLILAPDAVRSRIVEQFADALSKYQSLS